jgi:hypothetical protein
VRRRGRAAQRESAGRGETREGGAEGECSSNRAAWRAGEVGGAAKAESEPEKRPRLRRAGGVQMERGGRAARRESGTERESGAENDAR